PRSPRGRHDHHGVDAAVRPAERTHHHAQAGRAAGRARGSRRRAWLAAGGTGSGASVGTVTRNTGDREIPRREDRRANRAGTMDTGIVPCSWALVLGPCLVFVPSRVLGPS